MKFLSKINLNKKMIFSFSLVSIVIIVTLTFFAVNKSKEALIAEIGLNYQTQALNLMEKVDQSLLERYTNVSAFSSNELVRRKLSGEDVDASLQKYFNNMTIQYQSFDLMLLVDKNGKVVKSNTVKPDGTDLNGIESYIGKSVSDKEWFSKCITGNIKSGESYYADPYFDEWVTNLYNRKEPTMIFSAPVFDQNKNIIGVWCNFTNIKRTIGTLTSASVAYNKSKGIQTYVILVVDKNQKIIDDNQKPEDILKFSFKNKLKSLNLATSGIDSFLIEKNLRVKTRDLIQLNGIAASKGSGKYKGSGWACMTRVDTEEVFKPIDHLISVLLIIGFIMIVLVIIVTYLLARSIIGEIKKFERMIGHIANDVINGKLDARGNSDTVGIDFKLLVENTNNLIDAFVTPINVTAEYVDRISKGDMPPLITEEYKGDFNEIKTNLNQAIESINALVSDSNMLSKAAIEGKLSTRADANKHQGDFRKIVQGVNDTLDAVIGPLNVAAEYVDRISKGDMPPIIVDNYNGDFNEIKTNLNQAIVAINALVEDASLLAQAGVEGKLQTRADASKHQGDFRKIVDGVNNTLDSVIGPLNAANEVLAEMAGGNLAVSIDENYNGDLDTLKQSINNLAFSLRDMIKQISDGVETTATTSYELTTNADNLATAAQEQSAQADEVSSAVEEMSRTVTENAMSAGRTAEVAQKNGEIARDGGKVVEQTIIKMREIATVVLNSATNIQKLGESSKEIGEIVSVINDIADQTNLLALNAAIEAARAGEQGRGFAVVADEVRKLAERTTAATKQIANMIKGIQIETSEAVVAMNQGSLEVQNGISLADKAGESLHSVVSSSQEVLDMINQIVVASEEQSATSEQIAKNVMEISKVTNESTVRIEEIAHHSEDLTRLTDSLKEIVSQFRIDDVNNNTNVIINRKSIASKRNERQLHSGR